MLPPEDVIENGISVSALDNGYHIITYSLLNSDGASADTYYRVFDAQSMEFVTDETLIANHPNYIADRDSGHVEVAAGHNRNMSMMASLL